MSRPADAVRGGERPDGARISEFARRVGENVASVRGFRRMTVAELAKRADLSESTIRRVERGDPGARLSTLADIGFGLGYEAQTFFVELALTGRPWQPADDAAEDQAPTPPSETNTAEEPKA